jgi:serine protease Do
VVRHAEAIRLDFRMVEKLRKGALTVAVGSALLLGGGSLAPRMMGPQGDGAGRMGMVMEEGPRSGPAAPAMESAGGPEVCSAATRTEEIIEGLRSSSVMIDTDEGLGSGIIIGKDGGDTIIITNRHVVQSETPGPGHGPVTAGGMTVHNGGQVARVRRVLIAPNGIDLAAVIVGGDIGPAVRIAGETPRQGTRLIIIGSPLGIEDSVSEGVVSNFVSRRTDSGFPFTAIQTDAAINPGNSGGGFFLAGSGELIGITAFKLQLNPFSTAEGMGFGIPISIIQQYPISAWHELPMPAPNQSVGPPSPG